MPTSSVNKFKIIGKTFFLLYFEHNTIIWANLIQVEVCRCKRAKITQCQNIPVHSIWSQMRTNTSTIQTMYHLTIKKICSCCFMTWIFLQECINNFPWENTLDFTPRKRFRSIQHAVHLFILHISPHLFWGMEMSVLIQQNKYLSKLKHTWIIM